MPCTGVAQLPGFVESLRLLLREERYSLSDIALMFGVSRERMRQIADREGMPVNGCRSVGLHCVRVWDDTAHRFRPVSRGLLRQQRQKDRIAENRAKRDSQYAERRAMAVATIRRLADALGRTPAHAEVCRALGISDAAGFLPGWLRLYGDYSLAPLYREAGVEPLGRGGRRDGAGRKPMGA